MSQPSAPTSIAAVLRDVLARKLSRNPHYSLRALARDLGVSHTYLSLVINEKKALSMKKVVHFSRLLELGERESEAFVQAGAREARGRAFEKAELEDPRSRSKAPAETYFQLETDRFRLLGDWYHLPILDLTLTRGFRSDSRWVAARLGITLDQARDGIERLKRVGLLEERDGVLNKVAANLIVRPAAPTDSVRAYHRQMIGKALESLQSAAPADREARDITGVVLPVDPRRLPEAKRRIARFRLALMKFLSEGESSELYHLNLQLFPLTRPAAPRPKAAKGLVLKRGRR
jgi:uncharacterized protein (TIGR02147 family)